MFWLRHCGSSYAADCTLIWNIHAEGFSVYNASVSIMRIKLDQRRSLAVAVKDTETATLESVMSTFTSIGGRVRVLRVRVRVPSH